MRYYVSILNAICSQQMSYFSIFSQNLLKILQKCGGQYSNWSGFVFKDMAFTLIQRLSQVLAFETFLISYFNFCSQMISEFRFEKLQVFKLKSQMLSIKRFPKKIVLCILPWLEPLRKKLKNAKKFLETEKVFMPNIHGFFQFNLCRTIL